MRVLIIPEVYRPEAATACGTLNDAVAWVDWWLAADPHLHVYWLLPPRSQADYDGSYVHADRERVTLIEAEAFPARDRDGSVFTDDGYTMAELAALRERIFSDDGYVDVVIDQRRTGRVMLYKWLLEHTDHPVPTVRPVDVVVNVHDLQVPYKYRGCSHRNEYQVRMEITGAVSADGRWFTAGIDRASFRAHATDFLQAEIVDPALASSLDIGSPIDFDGLTEAYAATPQWLHLAGSFWKKKNADVRMSIAEYLYDRFEIRTILTSMSSIPERYRSLPWVDPYPEASRATYRDALARGDLAIVASDYETMPRTPFEQAASGQVLLLRDDPWIDDCVPGDYPLIGSAEELETIASRAVRRWPEAVGAASDLVAHVRTVRSPGRVGRRTYFDIERRVTEKCRRFARIVDAAPLERALREVGDRIELSAFTTAIESVLPEDEPWSRSDSVYALRTSGFSDRGNPGTPVFSRRAGRDPAPARPGGAGRGDPGRE